ncbi:MAG: hypothetical protein EXS01_01980 [Phycisphaerales bacterium]|nr:hypothetical protein [Phycisphaerales bacterium]
MSPAARVSLALLVTAFFINMPRQALALIADEASAAAPGASGDVQSQPHPTGPDAGALIAVARDVSPEWANILESARAKDPATFRAAAAKLGKRLASLAVLREHKPALYALRVEELRVQGQMEGLAPLWVSARLGVRVDEAAKLETQMRALAGTLVDLNLRSRAMELAEIDAVMRTMRADLERDARSRNASVEEVVNACRDGGPLPALGGRTPVDSTGASRKAAPPAPQQPTTP